MKNKTLAFGFFLFFSILFFSSLSTRAQTNPVGPDATHISDVSIDCGNNNVAIVSVWMTNSYEIVCSTRVVINGDGNYGCFTDGDVTGNVHGTVFTTGLVVSYFGATTGTLNVPDGSWN